MPNMFGLVGKCFPRNLLFPGSAETTKLLLARNVSRYPVNKCVALSNRKKATSMGCYATPLAARKFSYLFKSPSMNPDAIERKKLELHIQEIDNEMKEIKDKIKNAEPHATFVLWLQITWIIIIELLFIGRCLDLVNGLFMFLSIFPCFGLFILYNSLFF